jgi:hypothetical protein
MFGEMRARRRSSSPPRGAAESVEQAARLSFDGNKEGKSDHSR